MENLGNFAASDVYKDIKTRTGGEIYIGVVGPVRTGKSTFIKRFMDLLVLPQIESEHEKKRALDELPQSSGGRTITTTEPKFIPKDAAAINIGNDVLAKVRLIDCVGYMVDGASGHLEDDAERMVKTPWFDEVIPFTKAAEIGTKKVINDHSTIGIVVTTDASFGELPRENYIVPEERTISELKALGKPFIVLLNSQRPYSEDTLRLADDLSAKHKVKTVPVNCEQLKKEDINSIMEEILYEFPVYAIEFYTPKWLEMLPEQHHIKKDLVDMVKEAIADKFSIRDVLTAPLSLVGDLVKASRLSNINMADGRVKVAIDIDDSFYFEMISDLLGEPIANEYQLFNALKDMAGMRREYKKVLDAIASVRQKGYGVVMPYRDEISLEKPEVIRHGNKYGVKIKASSPSIHMIRANIETEIAPIVGTQEQALDLISYISETTGSDEGIWETNIFGKSIEQLVNDGICGRVATIGDDSQVKLQSTMQKIVNESNGGMVCIII